jgi:Putative Flp pilus-assembly TadE/G-like
MRSSDDSLLRCLRKDQCGQILPWMAFLGALIAGVGGLTVDLGHAYVCYRELQSSTDAAALAGAYAMALAKATPASVSAQVQTFSSVTGGVNATPNLPSPTIATTLRCVTDSTLVEAPCTAGPTGNNVIQVVQKSTIPTYFIRALSFLGVDSARSLTLTAASTATMMSGKATQVNVALLLDTTASMGTNDTDANCNNTRIHCALGGVQKLLKGLAPCTASSTQTNCTPFDQVSLFTFPSVQANTASNDTSCPSSNPTIVPYSTPTPGANWTAPTGTDATYQITDYLSDYSSTNQQGGSLSNSSALTTATGGSNSSNCGGMQTPGGDGTYYAGAIYAAQSSLMAAQAANPGSQNIMIILSDGDANAKSSKIAGSSQLSGNVYGSANDQCHQAITAANYATNNGTTVYTIAYGASNSGCSSDTGSLAISPCATMQQMSSGWSTGDRSHFYSDASASQNPGECTGVNDYSLDGIFTNIAAKFTQARLIPNGTT